MHPLPVMRRVHCVQPFCNLSDPAMEDLLARPRASAPCRGESGEGAGRDDDPDFRRWLARLLFKEIKDHLAELGVLLKKGGIVDATIISAPSLTGNRSNARGPEMHRTRKGNRRRFGMKPRIGDCESISFSRTVFHCS